MTKAERARDKWRLREASHAQIEARYFHEDWKVAVGEGDLAFAKRAQRNADERATYARFLMGISDDQS